MRFSSLLFSSLAGLALTCISGPAMSQASTKVLKDFTACDGSFFSSLHQDRKAWDGVPLGGAGNVSGIRVPDRNDKARNSVVFKRAINVNGLALTEYMDWYVDGKSLGKMLFWGFTISGRPAEVMERLRPLIKDEERLRKDGAGFMRAEVKIAQSPWVPAIVNSGAAAGLNKVERTLMIDLDESKNEVTVMCSLQGGLTAAVLKEVRPDMAEKEYPRELQAATFEDAPIPKDVAATAQSILAAGEAWKPKFKSLSYVERLAGANGKPGQAVKIELRALPDGLISKREMYGEMFSTRSLMLGNIALLKFQMVGMGDERPSVSSALRLDMPQALPPGTMVSVERESGSVPAFGGEQSSSDTSRCEARSSIDVDAVLPSLKGKGIALACTSSAGTPPYSMLYVESLGVALHLPVSADRIEDAKGRISDFQLER